MSKAAQAATVEAESTLVSEGARTVIVRSLNRLSRMLLNDVTGVHKLTRKNRKKVTSLVRKAGRLL